MEIVIRATIVFFLIWILIRAMGKRELAQLGVFELVLLVTIGDLVQQGVTQEDFSVTGALLAIGTLAFWILVSSYVSFRFARTRGVIEGHPVIVVHDGRVQREALRIVRYGVLEADGKFSFLTLEDEERRKRLSGQERETT